MGDRDRLIKHFPEKAWPAPDAGWTPVFRKKMRPNKK
jgi:hypothetical protein